MALRIIGDIHGEIGRYRECLEGSLDSIQLGDFSIKAEDFILSDADRLIPIEGDHRILLGNHDDYGALRTGRCGKVLTNPITDRDILHRWGLLKGTPVGTVFYVSGAESPDRSLRTEGRDWWREEELTFGQARECLLEWESSIGDLNNPINIVVTHDCPSRVAHMMHGDSRPTFTQQLLQEMWEIHKPNLWVFGHHHRSETIHFEETTFRCLDEGEFIDIYP